MTTDDIIRLLQLQPLPFEGGWFRETYRSTATVGTKSLTTAIYYLITPTSFSRLHRLPADELFHFYFGDPVSQLNLMPDGTSKVIMLGNDLTQKQLIQWLVPAGIWQGSRLKRGGQFALLGTTMSPGFDPSDLEIGLKDDLAHAYPDQVDEITMLTAS